MFSVDVVSPLKLVIAARQDEDGNSELELKIEGKVTEVLKEPSSLFGLSDLTTGLLSWLLVCYKKKLTALNTEWYWPC